jgi:hypothetical protein
MAFDNPRFPVMLQSALCVLMVLFALCFTVVFHSPWWLTMILGLLTLRMILFGFQIWQANHLDWWPSWDEGLPQMTQWSNIFVPVGIVFVLWMVLLPVFTKLRNENKPRATSATSYSGKNDAGDQAIRHLLKSSPSARSLPRTTSGQRNKPGAERLE